MVYQTIALVALICVGICTACLQSPTAISLAGTFRGSILTSLSSLEPYVAFRGIPYAKPPIGQLRFAKPEPFPQIEGVYNATDFGPICIQPANQPDRGEEDCLNLNVYTPLCEKDSDVDMELKKVLVFIHGGGFITGSSKEYLPGDLVSRGDVVVVTLNYRLGWLGFLRGDSPSLPGNQFLWDILLALNWVKDNIRGFHGDPQDVTLSGESAGSHIAAILSISPLAKGLFSRAILMSGVSMHLPTPPRTSNDLLRKAATELGCSQNGTFTDNDALRSQSHQNEGGADEHRETERVVKCLLSLPASAFDTKYNLRFVLDAGSSGDDILPRTMSELVADPMYLLEAGFLSRDYVLSVTKDDGYVLVNSDLTQIDTTSAEKAEQAAASLLGKPDSSGRELLEPYRKLREGNDDKALVDLFTDAFFIGGNMGLVRLFANIPDQMSSRPGSVFLTSFDHEPHYIPNSTMLHALDLCYLFDLEPDKLLKALYSTVKINGGFSEEDVDMKELFINVMADFIKTGDPTPTLSRKHKVKWLPAQKDSNRYLSLSTYPRMEDDILRRQQLNMKGDQTRQPEQETGDRETGKEEL